MEITKKKVVKSVFYYKDIQDIFEYGEATFGEKAAISFFEELLLITANVETHYLLHPECRHLETKTKKYRNIIFGSYLIIYRITPHRIEVLRAFHGSRSPKSIKESRKIKVD
ncbi:type II toxin-antitoxin system RelE/ParE family toxin [Flavobacterium restrictum]|uniref:Type II toxin-antitoxin system RelE/ParE family toxin n=1 Tax=Flavobacterium restrictum TaxID=2594428 RepID=A0A553E5T2_9FLAO|nr:type II toxin-antitoxin system RelE/ParE family toxin [Flavobacterium restrictum]TRX40360.1 type II toxin-antitoxin system RelE/ParE family toxin [Flavobacterium restrictum]